MSLVHACIQIHIYFWADVVSISKFLKSVNKNEQKTWTENWQPKPYGKTLRKQKSK